MSPAEKSAPPSDAQMKARALSRWEGEGGTIAGSGIAGDALDEGELRILARIGAAALAEWQAIPADRREALVCTVCKPLGAGDRARVKANIAAFLRENGHR